MNKSGSESFRKTIKFDKLKFDTLKIGQKAVRPSLLSTT